MSKIASAVILLLALGISALAQGLDDNAQDLNAKIAELYGQGKLDEAVPLAEALVKLQRRTDADSQRNLVNALETLSQIKLTRFKRTTAELNSPGLQKERANKLSELMRADGKDIEVHLREAVALSKTATLNSDQSVTIRGNLAWILYRYSPPFPRPVVEYDKSSRDRLESQNRLTFQKRADEAGTVLADAIKIAEADANVPSAPLIIALYNLAEFEAARSNFENAIANYEKCIAAIKTKNGKYAKDLLVPLASYAKVLAATNQEAAASDAVSLMVRISGTSTQYPKELLNLSHRTDKSFAPYLGPSAVEGSRASKERAELAGRRVVSNVAAAGGDVAGASIATSTNSRDYYDYSSGRTTIVIIFVKVLVDENGNVTEAEAMTSNTANKTAAEKIVREWKFRPFIAAGKPTKMLGYVECRLMLDLE